MDLIHIASRVAGHEPVHVYVDLDETLVASARVQRDPDKEDRLRSSGYELAEVADGAYLVALRPGARELLSSLRSLGRVSLCTAASRPYADEVLQSFGLTSLLDEVISKEDFGSGIPDGRVILIDNLPPEASDIQEKLRTVGAAPANPSDGAHYMKHLVRVSDFYGQPGDSELSRVADRVRAALAS